MSEYKKCDLTIEEIEEIIIKRLENARLQMWNFEQKGKYQTDDERAWLESKLLSIETLAIELGIIDNGTI